MSCLVIETLHGKTEKKRQKKPTNFFKKQCILLLALPFFIVCYGCEVTYPLVTV